MVWLGKYVGGVGYGWFSWVMPDILVPRGSGAWVKLY